MVVTVYMDKCDGIESCLVKGICITLCASNAIMNINDKPSIIEESCTNCGICTTNCPNEALSR